VTNLELLQFFRWCVDEPTEDLVSDVRAYSLLNIAKDHVANIIRDLDQGYFEASATLDTVAGQNYIAIPATVYADGIKRLELNDGVDGGPGTTVRFRDKNGAWCPAALSGISVSPEWAFISGNTLVFDRNFSTAETARYKLWYDAVLTPITVANAALTCAIPEQHHFAISAYANLIYMAKAEDDGTAWGIFWREQKVQIVNNLQRRQSQQARYVRDDSDDRFYEEVY